MFTNGVNIGFPLWAWVEQTVHGKETRFQVKKMFWTQLSVKKLMPTVFCDMKGPIIIDFHEKITTVNRVYYYRLFSQNSAYLLNESRTSFEDDKFL